MHYIKPEELNSANSIKLINEAVSSGEVIIYPTDTLYGIGGNFLSEKAHLKTDNMKGRAGSPYSAAVESVENGLSLCETPSELQAEIMAELFPGKVTLLLKVSEKIPALLTKNSPLIGIRIPDNDETMSIIKAAGSPLITTSVNFSGEESLNTVSDIKEKFIERLGDHKPSLMIESRFDFTKSSGSTIIDISATPGRVLRKGDNYKTTLEKLNSITGWNLS